MEVAVIDWKNLDSRFVKDDLFEHFNAPQWVDFSVPDAAAAVDDEAWFCRPDCNHPKTVEDFYSAGSELQRAASVSEIPSLRERSRSFRDASLKSKGQSNRMVGDGENQNPNFMTPPRLKARILKETIKSSAEREAMEENSSSFREQQPRRLRSTLSARNLFGGGGLMNKVSEFCSELKKLASRAKEKENVERTPIMVDKQKVKGQFDDEVKVLVEKQKERKPLLECESAKISSVEKQTKKLRRADAENTPIRVDVKNIKRNLDESLMQIRTNPPTPQWFSANPGPTKGGAPHKTPQSRPPQERGILQELRQGSGKDSNNGTGKKSNHGGGHVSILAERETRGLDVLWFLKPCTLSS